MYVGSEYMPMDVVDVFYTLVISLCWKSTVTSVLSFLVVQVSDTHPHPWVDRPNGTFLRTRLLRLAPKIMRIQSRNQFKGHSPNNTGTIPREPPRPFKH